MSANWFLPALLLISALTFPATAQELLKVSCTDEEKAMSDRKLSIRTCDFGELRSVSTGEPNTKGHYRYSYELLQKKNDQFVPIEVTELLRSEDKLLETINRKLGLDYNELLEDPVSGPCLVVQGEAPVFGWKDLGFTFDEFGYHFHANFSVKDNCSDLEHSTVSFTPAKMKRYLKN